MRACVLVLQNVFSYYRIYSLTAECVLLLQNVPLKAEEQGAENRVKRATVAATASAQEEGQGVEAM
jgi:hypothetical protein